MRNNITPIKPTYTNGYIATSNDALIILQAVLNGSLPLVDRRPHENERSSLIKSGNIFVFIEETSNIKRWTDGTSWSPSRILGRFLIYRELSKNKNLIKNDFDSNLLNSKLNSYPVTACEMAGGEEIIKTTIKRRRSNSFSNDTNLNSNQVYDVSNNNNGTNNNNLNEKIYRSDGLVKKSMSLSLYSNSSFRKTIHLVSYYRSDDVLNKTLQLPSLDSNLKNIKINFDLLESLRNTSLGHAITNKRNGEMTIEAHGFMDTDGFDTDFILEFAKEYQRRYNELNKRRKLNESQQLNIQKFNHQQHQMPYQQQQQHHQQQQQQQQQQSQVQQQQQQQQQQQLYQQYQYYHQPSLQPQPQRYDYSNNYQPQPTQQGLKLSQANNASLYYQPMSDYSSNNNNPSIPITTTTVNNTNPNTVNSTDIPTATANTSNYNYSRINDVSPLLVNYGYGYNKRTGTPNLQHEQQYYVPNTNTNLNNTGTNATVNIDNNNNNNNNITTNTTTATVNAATTAPTANVTPATVTGATTSNTNGYFYGNNLNTNLNKLPSLINRSTFDEQNNQRSPSQSTHQSSNSLLYNNNSNNTNSTNNTSISSNTTTTSNSIDGKFNNTNIGSSSNNNNSNNNNNNNYIITTQPQPTQFNTASISRTNTPAANYSMGGFNNINGMNGLNGINGYNNINGLNGLNGYNNINGVIPSIQQLMPINHYSQKLQNPTIQQTHYITTNFNTGINNSNNNNNFTTSSAGTVNGTNNLLNVETNDNGRLSSSSDNSVVGTTTDMMNSMNNNTNNNTNNNNNNNNNNTNNNININNNSNTNSNGTPISAITTSTTPLGHLINSKMIPTTPMMNSHQHNSFIDTSNAPNVAATGVNY